MATTSQQIAWVKIAVNPHRWSGPGRRRKDAFPKREHGVALDNAV
jgi:hypothetical protein